MIPWLEDINFRFPPIESALEEPNGLLAAGGDLSPSLILSAYKQGIFPWYCEPDPILWWSPNPRATLKPDEVHISRSMQKFMRTTSLTVTIDECFDGVIDQCAHLRQDTEGTWITEEMKQAYIHLHELGHAHSVEVWESDKLVGGLYGIAIGTAFFGESMFSTVSNASKLAFIHLCKKLAAAGFTLIDCQVSSSHLSSLGAKDIPRTNFQLELEKATSKEPRINPWA